MSAFPFLVTWGSRDGVKEESFANKNEAIQTALKRMENHRAVTTTYTDKDNHTHIIRAGSTW